MNLDAIRGLSQPDQRSCGPSSLVAAHILVDPAYAATQNPHAFATSVLALHRQITAPSFGGRAQLPWPRALGTPPWAVAHAMSSYTGARYRTRMTRFGGRAGPMSRMREALSAGRPCPLYVGDRWLPRHVVLAVEPTGDGVLVYNPAHGTVGELLASDFEAGKLTTFGRWVEPWFAVLPDAG